MTLAEFIAARLDEMAALAEAAARCRGEYDWCPEPQVIADGLNLPDAQFIRYWDPARALRQVAAMRAILAFCADDGSMSAAVERCDISTEEFVTGKITGQHVLRLLAAVYSDHPDCRQEWKP